jgi:hypothetical protein
MTQKVFIDEKEKRKNKKWMACNEKKMYTMSELWNKIGGSL